MISPRSLPRLFATVAFCASAAGSALAASFSTTVTSVLPTDSINLTALGTLDWAAYDTWTATPASSTLGTLSGPGMFGGSGIGTLQSSLFQGPTVMSGSPPAYTWTNGDSPAAGSYEGMRARYSWALSGSAVAATTERTLYIFIGVMDGAGSVSINLPGAASATVSIPSTGGVNVPSYSLLAIDFIGDTAGDNLTFTLTALRPGIGAIALDAAAIPEPSSYAALAGLGMLGFAALRRRAVRVGT